jgi:DNA polymerase-3 subunit delta
MTPDDLQAELEQGRLRPAYLFAGAEPLLRDDCLSALRRVVVEEGAADFNLDRFRGDQVKPSVLEDALKTLPVMAERRLVVLEDPESRRGAALGDALAALVPTLESGGSTVLAVRSAKADKRSRWVKALADGFVDCDPPKKSRDIAAFVRVEADRQGLTLERGAAEALAERVGPQLLLLRQEIAKLGLLAGADGKITRAHVGAGTPQVAEEPIWDLTDAIGEGRTADAVALLTRLSSAGAPAPVILGSLVSHFRRLMRAGHGGNVAGPPFVRKKLESQARRYGARRLRSCLDAIHETDLAIKGAGALRPELALERLVLALAT